MALHAGTFTISRMVAIPGLPSRYRIETLLGEGGFGKVYRVFDSQLDRILALKVISQESASVRASLMKEFKVLSNLQHPNLVRVFDFGTLESRLFYFTMEYIEGQSLRSYLRNADNLRRIPSIIGQLLDALGYLHKSGVVHGDIKPDNIMITGEGLAKLLDFGLISSGNARRGDRMSGTARFLAPEILREGESKGPSTDLYALGAAFVESIEDRDFPAILEQSEAQIKGRRAGVHRALAEAGVKNPSSLASFILDLCDADPLQRPASMALYSDHEREKMTFRPVFTGRQKELDEIARFLRPSQTAQKVLVLRGPRGIGKKSIIRKAMQGEQLKQRLCIDLSSMPYDYFSAGELVNCVASQVGSAERDILTGKISAISASAKTLKKATETHAIGQRSLVLFNHIIDGLQEIASRRPIILSLPDIDRLGQEYLRFLNQILNHMDLADFNLKVVLSLNADVPLSEDATQTVDGFSTSQKTAFFEIGGFSSEMLAGYFIGAFKEELLSEKERRNLLERTKGIPLVIEAAVRHLISEKIIRLEEGRWAFDRTLFAQSGLFIGGDEAFGLQLSNLEPSEQYLLELLAILDQEVSISELENLIKDSISSWALAIKSLIGRAILVETSKSMISFAHPQYRELILEKCAKSAAIELNRQVAEYLALAEPCESLRIMQHYVAADDIDNAIKYARDVMTKLYSAYMPYDCLRLFTHLRDLAQRRSAQAQLLQANAWLARLEVQAGLLIEAIETYSTLIKDGNNPHTKAQYMIERATVIDMSGNTEKAINSIRNAQKYIRSHSLQKLMGYTYFHLGYLAARNRMSNYEKALALFKNTDIDMYLITAARLFERYNVLGDMRKRNRNKAIMLQHMHCAGDEAKKEVFRCLAGSHFISGEYESQRMCLEKKISIEKKQDDMHGMIQSLNSLAGHYYTKGDNASFLNTLQETYSLAMRFNHTMKAITAGHNFVLAYRVLGDYGKALGAIRQTEKLFQERKVTIGSILRVMPAQIFALLGDATNSEFLSRVKTLYREATKLNNIISLGHYHMCYSTHHNLNRRYKKALSSTEKALALFKKADDRDDVALAYIQKSIILVSLGDLKGAARNIKQATKIYDAIHCEYLKPLLMLGRGMVARCSGGDDARQLLAEGLRTSKKMGTREYTWQIQRELALYHRDRGEVHKALDYFQDAVETLKQITETLDEEELKVSYLETPLRMRIFDEIKELKKETRQ